VNVGRNAIFCVRHVFCDKNCGSFLTAGFWVNIEFQAQAAAVDIFCESEFLQDEARRCAVALHVELNRAAGAAYQLWFTETGVYLQIASEKHGRIQVDFCAGGAAHRRLYGGGKGQMIAKAVGVSGKIQPSIFDATAGLGGDAFVLACLGCTVTMMERSPVAFALLQDGLARARSFSEEQDGELALILARMQLLPGDSVVYLREQVAEVADVIYLDPMFPERRKAAAVKKEMQAFHSVVGEDADAQALLNAALPKARYRLTVKRPRHAPPIEGASVTYTLEGKSSRYDIYALRSLTKQAG
jgi:16S rRNA (guanine1516-N2)-methyltransferase